MNDFSCDYLELTTEMVRRTFTSLKQDGKSIFREGDNVVTLDLDRQKDLVEGI